MGTDGERRVLRLTLPTGERILPTTRGRNENDTVVLARIL